MFTSIYQITDVSSFFFSCSLTEHLHLFMFTNFPCLSSPRVYQEISLLQAAPFLHSCPPHISSVDFPWQLLARLSMGKEFKPRCRFSPASPWILWLPLAWCHDFVEALLPSTNSFPIPPDIFSYSPACPTYLSQHYTPFHGKLMATVLKIHFFFCQ